MNAVHVVGVLFGIAVFMGALIQIVSNPKGANALFSAGANTVVGVTHSLEGK